MVVDKSLLCFGRDRTSTLATVKKSTVGKHVNAPMERPFPMKPLVDPVETTELNKTFVAPLIRLFHPWNNPGVYRVREDVMDKPQS
ncbi:MAG: hypothetical protein NT149_04780 [Candidatus Gottesmanbacteria bacterium]|nr:hypothetical protein [Candidatus Gottesmanbacteria bacterium]